MSDDKMTGEMLAHIVGASYAAYLLSCEENGGNPVSKSEFYNKFQEIMPDFMELVAGSSGN